jgi:hypothetical protein
VNQLARVRKYNNSPQGQLLELQDSQEESFQLSSLEQSTNQKNIGNNISEEGAELKN